MTTARTFAVEERGVGRPDYALEVATGKIRPGFLLKYEEGIKAFLITYSLIASPFPYVQAPLGAGLSQSLIDGETGLAMPYTVPAGYYIEMVTMCVKGSQDLSIELYIEGFFAATLLHLASGIPCHDTGTVPVSTMDVIVPGAAHTIDITVTNQGGADLYAGIMLTWLLVPYGTDPLPLTKTVRCKNCGNTTVLSYKEHVWTCTRCGTLNRYWSTRRGPPC